MLHQWFLTAIAFLSALNHIIGAQGRLVGKDEIHAKQAEAARRWHGSNPRREELRTHRQERRELTFSNPRAAEFYVDGTKIPDVDFDVGPSYAGLLPISSNANETRKVRQALLEAALRLMTRFRWHRSYISGSFLPDHKEVPMISFSGEGLKPLVEDYARLNFGQGVFQENGPMTWAHGQARPTKNEWSWTNLSSVLWVEQPVGTGFSQGVPNIKNEHDLAAQLVGTLELDHTTMKRLDEKSTACGYTGYMEKYVTYPPKGLLPLPGGDDEITERCDLWDDVFNATLLVNPAFNIYRIFDTFPILWDVTGFPGSFPATQGPIYFDRPEVKKAINAPVNVTWSECSNQDVFPKGDSSPPTSLSVLPRVIEKSNRTVIVHGLADFILVADGARIAIQNMTWGGKQGFQSPIADDSFIVDGMGAMGTAHTERGFTYIEVVLSGHMVPMFSPKSAYQSMQYLMGFRDTP